ncbi:hypothetical protein DM872_12530 [Pseudomonas taiwanensis]|nr:hypothetical protein [Pseudomonas taiwanensis]
MDDSRVTWWKHGKDGRQKKGQLIELACTARVWEMRCRIRKCRGSDVRLAPEVDGSATAARTARAAPYFMELVKAFHSSVARYPSGAIPVQRPTVM